MNEQPIIIDEQPKYIDEQLIDVDEQQIENDIINETNWKGVSFRENADLHISLISQGKFDKKVNDKYDTTYYYPSTAGQDVDLFIDSSFDFRHPEFSNKDEREAKCLYYITRGALMTSPHEDYCIGKLFYRHGLITSEVAAGLAHGVASKANIYGIVVDDWTSNMFIVFQYIKENRLRPNKTVFNLLLGDYYHDEKDKELINFWKGLIDSITEEGAIIVAGAGNDNIDADYTKLNYKMYPCSYDNVVCVGGIDNYGFNGKDQNNVPEIKIMKTEYYRMADFSNYGHKVDIFGPGYVTVEYKDNDGSFIRYADAGTSYTTPIVVGVIACFISENPYTKFDTESMRQYLQELGQKDILEDIPEGNPNIFINNGKRIIYPGNEDEESEIEVEEDYDKPKDYDDPESDSDYEEQSSQEPMIIYNEQPSNYDEYSTEISSYYDDDEYETHYYDFEYPNEYEKPTDAIYHFEEHEWDFKKLAKRFFNMV